MLTSLWFWCAEQAARILPSMMLKRLFKTERIEKEIDVNWSSKEAARIWLRGNPPDVQISLRVGNRSLVPVVLDRLILELWIGQPVAELMNIRRVPVNARSTLECVTTREHLAENQIKAFSQYVKENRLTEKLVIRADLFFDCAAGPFQVTKNIELGGDSVVMW